jgi:lipopolysaccharide biosynthesis glycosyltransferase
MSMASLIANKHPSTKCRVFVVCDGVDPKRKEMFKSFSRPDFAVEIVDYDNTTYEKKDYELGKYITSATYIRLKLPSIFPKIGRLLYLDGDVIVQDDLRELFEMDLDGKCIAGSPDFGMCIDSVNWDKVDYIRNTLPDYETEYVNAGVLLMDLDKLRECGFEETCKKLYDERTDFIFADQDIINFGLQGKKKLFPVYWNCPIFSLQVNYGHHSEEFLHKRIGEIYHVIYDKDIFDIAYRAKIIHLNGNKNLTFGTKFVGTLYDRYLKMALDYIKEGRGK